MKHKLIKILMCALTISFISSISFAFDLDSYCESTAIEVNSRAEIIEVLENVNESNLNDNIYVVCLKNADEEQPVKIGGAPITITGKNLPLIISGLFLAPQTTFGSSYDGTIVSVAEPMSGIVLHNLKIVQSEDAKPTKAISITGSNVTIEDSEIHFKDIGIEVNAKNVKVKNTKLIGDGTLESKGIYVNNQSKLEGITPIKPTKRELLTPTLLAEDDIFEDSDYGIFINVGTGVKVNKATFKIVDSANAIFWANKTDVPIVDVNMVGKKLDESGERVTEIGGIAPSCVGKIDLYLFPNTSQENLYDIAYISSSEVYELNEGDKLCFEASSGEESSYCIEEGSCVFKIDEINIDSQDYNLTFTFSDSKYNTYSMSEIREIASIQNIEVASIPVVATPGPVSSGMTGDDLEPDDYSDTSSGSGSEMASVEGAGGGSPASSGMKMGCSLAQHQITAKHAFPELLLVMLGTVGLLIGLLRRRSHT